MGYIRPVGNVRISDDYGEHVARGSVEPGVDYVVGRGTPVVAPDAGTIRVVDMGTAGADGRRVTIEFDNGDWGSGIHLNSGAPVRVGQHVNQGQTIAYSGNSRNGKDSDPTMGAHLHWTFWRQPGRVPVPGGSPRPVNFEQFVMTGNPAGGSSVWSVVQKQTFLVSIGLDTGGIDGDFGPKSIAATRTFQGWAGLEVDGDFGPLTTRAAMTVQAGGKFVARSTAEIQRFLAGRGLYSGAIDDQWGPKTSLGTLRFQRSVGLTPDAQWGNFTDAKAFTPTPTPPPPVTGAVGRNITTRKNSEIQTELKARGLYTGAIDGVFGPGMTAAVIALQKQAGEPVVGAADGIWGARTDVYGFRTTYPLKCVKQGVRISWGGTAVAGRKITGVNVHYYGHTGDDRTYFAGENERRSLPSVALDTDGEFYGYVVPRLQPWSTGSADKDRLTIEIRPAVGAPEWSINVAQIESLIELFVELAVSDTIDGIDVTGFVLDRAHIQGDQEFRPTACPGPFIMAHLDEWIAEARRRVDAQGEPDPDPDPDVVQLSREQFDRLKAAHAEALAVLEEADS